MNDSYVFYLSFHEALTELSDEQYGKLMRIINEYALHGTMPENLSGLEKMVFTLIQPQIDANNKRKFNGGTGGRPIKTNGFENEKPMVSEIKTNGFENEKPMVSKNENHGFPQKKPNVNVNVNVNANENVNDNANVNENVNVSPIGEKEKVDSYESTEKKAAQSSEEVTVEDAMIGVGFSPDLEVALKDWCGYKAERHEKYKPLGLKSLITQVANNARQYGDIAVVRAIRDSMASGYKGIVFDKLRASPSGDLSHDEFVDRWRNV